MWERLRLRLRAEGGEPVPVSAGVDFVGWRTWWSHRVPRRRTLANLRERVAGFERRHVVRAFGGRAWRVTVPPASTAPRRATVAERRSVDLGALTAVLGSYGGHLRHGGAWQAWTGLWDEHPWLGALFACERWRPRPRWMRWHARAGEGFRDAYRRLLRAAPPEGLIFLRVGRYVEFYGPQRCRVERVLGLRAVALPRAGYAFTAGFPVRHTTLSG